MQVKRNLRDTILESPGWKTAFSVLIPIAAGVLSGTFVAEITTNDGLAWGAFYRSASFYGLVALAAVTFFFHREAYLHEKRIDRFSDAEYCRAYMRSKCLPEAAEKYKEMIRAGDGKEFAAAMKEIERVLKP